MAGSNVVGMDELLKKVQRMSEIPAKVIGDALEKGAAPIVEQAKANAPVRTGKLQGAIRSGKRKKSGAWYKKEIGTFQGEAPHAHLAEFGHGGPKPAPPHPFLRTAYEAKKGEAYDLIREELRAWVHGETSGK